VRPAGGFRRARRQPGHGRVDTHAGTGAARVADGGRAGVLVGGVQHLAAFVFVGGRQDHHVGDGAQVGVVIGSGMGGAVLAHQPGAVDAEGDVQVLQGDIVHQLVVAALQESGINGHHRLQPLAGHARRQRDRMLLGNGDIVVAVGKLAGETHHAGAFAHGRGDADQAVVGGGHVAQPVAEDVGVLGLLHHRGGLAALGCGAILVMAW